MINWAKFSTTGLIQDWAIYCTDLKQRQNATQDIQCKDQKILIRKLECVLSFFNYFQGLPWNELENHSQCSTPLLKRGILNDRIYFCGLLQMFDKECARGNAPCRSSPRAPPPPVTEGVAPDKLKPSGSQPELNPLNHHHADSLSPREYLKNLHQKGTVDSQRTLRINIARIANAVQCHN